MEWGSRIDYKRRSFASAIQRKPPKMVFGEAASTYNTYKSTKETILGL
jgi:hypothetical protein